MRRLSIRGTDCGDAREIRLQRFEEKTHDFSHGMNPTLLGSMPDSRMGREGWVEPTRPDPNASGDWDRFAACCGDSPVVD